MLRIRMATAVVLVMLVGSVLVYAPVWAFDLLVIAAIGLALDELLRLLFPADWLGRVLGGVYGVAVAVVHVGFPGHTALLPLLMGGCFLVGVVLMFRSTTLERFLVRLGGVSFGAIYIVLGLSYLAWLRHSDHGRTLVTMTIAMAALADTFAYAVGRTVGRYKLAPLISPNKTVEGFAAGFVGSVAAAIACRALLWPELPVGGLVCLALLIGLVAPLGDLVESAIKRAYHIKDTGALLPGHGGMFDRADAYIVSAPVVYYYMKYVMDVI
ncbi:MAG: phosphatidate cytidylyltransferase [Deltaproteobacteria bacterium]|nr:phosphatidate cytidylyltransferase [Deltaproteobacteria bacterium]